MSSPGPGASVAATAHSAIKDGGRPLERSTRDSYEARFGAPFDDVRVHDGPRAGAAADDLNARAFTVGSDVVFAEGEYAPATERGGRLLAHELTHVVQQRGSGDSPTLQRAASDFQITGKHPDASSFSSIAFFGLGKAGLDADERTKVGGLAVPPGRDLTLRGFASEEGRPSANARLVDRRINAVARVLAAHGHDPTKITRDPRPTEGAGQIDYRRWRAVEVIPSGGPPSTPACATTPEFETPCPADKLKMIRAATLRALGMISKAYFQLSIPPLFPEAAALRQRLFTGASVAQVKSGLFKTAVQLVRYLAGAPRCGTECADDCENTLAQNSDEGAAATLTVCPRFYAKPDADYRAAILLHEASHGAPGLETSDHSGEGDRLIDRLSTTEALGNADSYLLLVYLINNPGGLSIGPSTPDTITGLSPTEKDEVMTAVARVEQWIDMADTDTSLLYGEIKDARTAGWPAGGSFWEDAMTNASRRFGLTRPPTKPKKRDQERMAALYDRYHRMDNATDQQLELKKGAGSRVRWSSGPGDEVTFPPSFFGKPVLQQIRKVLRALVRATSGISRGLRNAYVKFTEDVRDQNSLGP